MLGEVWKQNVIAEVLDESGFTSLTGISISISRTNRDRKLK